MRIRWCGETENPTKNFVHGCRYGWLSHHQEMSRFSFAAVFFFGVAVAIAVTYLSAYFKIEVFLKIFSDNPNLKSQHKVFSPMPDESQVHVVDEGTLGLVVRHADISEKNERTENIGLESEAVGSLHAALDMKKVGKYDKALKLFEHAAALSPKHPDILNYYGEFLEQTKNDVVTADQLYFRALMVSPSHEEALANRQRTARIVEEIDRSVLRRIDGKRDILRDIPDSNKAFRRAKKEAYFQYIYHTAGIEGNTMTLSQTRSIVETRMAVAGKSIMEHNEILGLDAAMKYINATLVNRIGGIRVKDILEIHRRVLGFVDPIESGMFRRTQVYVGGHIPPGPNEITVLMDDFETWINSDRALRMHPIRYAALAHYKLVHIHPFTDGNGRTSRLLMNLILMQAGFPPVIIIKQDRHRYYECLELANKGDVRPFVRFIAEYTENTLDLYLWATKEYSTELPALGQEHSSRLIISEDFGLNESEE